MMRKMVFTIIPLALVVIFASATRSALLTRAQSNIDNHHFESAFHQIKWLAIVGDSRAQYLMGNLFASGKGVEKNNRAAVRWFDRSCSLIKTDACPAERAMYHVAERYLKGQGVEKDQKEALWWLEKSADAGVAEAAEILISMTTTNSKEISSN